MGTDVYIRLRQEEDESVFDAVAAFLNLCEDYRGWPLDTPYREEDVKAYVVMDRLLFATGMHNRDYLAKALIQDVYKEDFHQELGIYRLVREHVLYQMHFFCYKQPILEVGRLHSLLPNFEAEEYCGDIENVQDIMALLTNLGVCSAAMGRIEKVYYG